MLYQVAVSKKDKQLIVVPCCGLCNRLQAIVCGQLLAEDAGRELFINWESNGDCGVGLDELIESVFKRAQVIPDGVSCYSSIQRHKGCTADQYQALLNNQPKEDFRELKSDASDSVAVFTCHQFMSYFHDKRFIGRLRQLLSKVQGGILNKVTEYQAANFTESTIGVHVRRTDWRNQKTLDYYFRNMDKLANTYSQSSFYVCSDDPESADSLRRRYTNSHAYPVRAYQRGQKDAIEDALVELLLLSRTCFLLGTPGSSFTAMAQAVGGMPCNFRYGLSMARRDFLLGNVSLKVVLSRLYHRSLLACRGY